MTETTDHEHHTEDAVESAHRVGEDLASIGFVAGTEVVEEIGLATEFWDYWQNIQQTQLSLLIEDYTTTLANLGHRHPMRLFLDHVGRRLEHLNMGAGQTAAILANELERFQEMERSLWIPYFRLLREDQRLGQVRYS